MPYSAPLIAYAFVKKGIEERTPVTQMKLQKMVYFAQGYYLAKYGQSLIEENFEAWRFGPVIPSIYQTYKIYGSEPILDIDLLSSIKELELELFKLDLRALDAINYTWEATKRVSANNLSAWTHKAGSPWAKAYKPNVSSIKIDNKEIGEYFSKLLVS